MVTVCNEHSAPPVTPEALEVLAFNMERGIYPEALGDFLKSSFPAEELSDHDAVAAKIYL